MSSAVTLMKEYVEAKKLANCLFAFPYQSPADCPDSVQNDSELIKIITDIYAMTRAPDGKVQSPDVSAQERIQLQAHFKKRIYPLLEECLSANPLFAPAYLLYPRVAEFNTRAADRPTLIVIYERFLPMVDEVAKGTAGYDFIQEDNKNIVGDSFERVERHIAYFHYELSSLYKKVDRLKDSTTEYNKAKKVCPQIFGRGKYQIKAP